MIDLSGIRPERRSFLRAVASVTTGAGLATLGLMSPPAIAVNSNKVPVSTGLPFKVYDGTLYRGKPDLSRHGIRPVNIIYGQRFWADLSKKDQLPERAAVIRLAREAAGRGELAVLDIEHWYLHRGNAEVSENLHKYLTVIEWFREEAPGLQVGYFGMLPIADFDRVSGALGWLRYQGLKMDNDRLKPLAAAVDVIFPDLYTFSADRERWSRNAAAQIREARRYEKPVIVFLWPQYSEVNKEIGHQYLPADFWALQLDTARQLADGVVIWGGWDGARSDYAQWNDRAPWWQATRQFMQRLESRASA